MSPWTHHGFTAASKRRFRLQRRSPARSKAFPGSSRPFAANRRRPSPKFFASGWVAAAKISSSSAIWCRSKSKWPAIWAPLASWCSAAVQRSTTCPHCRRAINPTCASKTSALCCALFANCDPKEEANMNKPVNRFEFFHEAKPPKGAEGWERMYPYFLVSQPEGRDGEDKKFWFAD